MQRLLPLLVLLAALAGAGRGSAGDGLTVVDFDSAASGRLVDFRTYRGDGVTLRALGRSPGSTAHFVVFNTSGADTPPNILGAHDSDYFPQFFTAPIRIEFDAPTDHVSFWLSGGPEEVAEAYNAAGALLDVATRNNQSPDRRVTFQRDEAEIASVLVRGEGFVGLVFIDTLRFRKSGGLRLEAAPEEVHPSILAYNGFGANPTQRHGGSIEVRGAPNTPFRIWVEADAQSGGHTHGPQRPHGWILSAPIAEFPPIGAAHPVGTTQYSSFETGLAFQLDAAGMKSLHYVAPGLGGGETITVSTTEADPNERTVAGRLVMVRVPELSRLSARANPALSVYGLTAAHGENDYGTAALLNALEQAGARYQADQQNDAGPDGLAALIDQLAGFGYDFPNRPASGFDRGGDAVNPHLPRAPDQIFVNDISLPSGGLFDVGVNWLAKPGGHVGHQAGRHVDLKTVHLTAAVPYTLQGPNTGPQTVRPAALNRMLPDPRLLGRGRAPFRNEDSYVDGMGLRRNYTTQVRRQMNGLVQRIRHRRLTLLLQAVQHPAAGTTGVFAKEGNHIHVQYE